MSVLTEQGQSGWYYREKENIQIAGDGNIKSRDKVTAESFLPVCKPQQSQSNIYYQY